MKIDNQLLRIQALPYDEKGEKLEPEAMPAERILLSESPMLGNIDRMEHGNLPVKVTVQGTAGQFANNLRSMCAQCKHFDNLNWLKRKQQLENSGEGVRLLNNMHWELMNQGLDNDHDREQALGMMGYCKAISEMQKDDVLVHLTGGCPPEYCTPSQPNGFFDDVNFDSKRIADKAYDSVMKQAEGKPQ